MLSTTSAVTTERSPRAAAAARRSAVWRPSRTIHSPPTMTSRTSAAVAANTALAAACSGVDARQAHGVERERGEVGERAGLEAAALRPAERGVAAGGGGA